jgi:murein DD-endopeptidase MepM/ murein hydrolase activator NlpD
MTLSEELIMTYPVTAWNGHRAVLSRHLWIKYLGWLSGLGLFGGGMALAQTPASELTIPESTVEVSEPVSAPVPAVPVAPEPVVPEFTPSEAMVAPEVRVNPPLSSEMARPSGRSDEGPTAIVLSERSTGCRAVLSAGQVVANGPCAPRVKPDGTVAAGGGLSGSSSAVGGSALASGWAAVGRTVTPLLGNVYRRTPRPLGLMGNGNTRLMFPLSVPAVISSVFGWRLHPISGTYRFHSGTDLAAPLGTPVLAAFAGRVAIADWLGGYGLTVTLEHNQGAQQTLYGHLSELFVRPGDMVKQGEVIGRVGSTGNSTGPHLHFEVRQLTPDGWVALDAGEQLEYALAQLVKSLQVAKGQEPAAPVYQLQLGSAGVGRVPDADVNS